MTSAISSRNSANVMDPSAMRGGRERRGGERRERRGGRGGRGERREGGRGGEGGEGGERRVVKEEEEREAMRVSSIAHSQPP